MTLNRVKYHRLMGSLDESRVSTVSFFILNFAYANETPACSNHSFHTPFFM